MIEVDFNGEKKSVEEGTKLQHLLDEAKIESRFCAVEVNLEILPKSDYATYSVKSGDRIEVVTLVGGG